MPTPDIPNVELANTFNDWRVVTNNLVDVANDLRSDNYTKEEGTLIISSPDTGLSITANATIGGTLTVGNVEISGEFLVGGAPISEVATGGANTVKVSQNSSSTLSQVSLNFVNTSTIVATVAPGSSGNANVSFAYVGGAIEGVQGAQGYQGLRGYQGYQGVLGAKGDKGDRGDRGYQGYQGYQGNQGFQGTLGSRGYQGYQGHQGLKGDKGNTGDTGYQGVQGTALGSGVLYLPSNQTLGTSYEVIRMSTVDFQDFSKGEFLTASYRYDLNSPAKLLVNVQVLFSDVDKERIYYMGLYNGTTLLAYTTHRNDSGSSNLERTLSISRVVSLTSTDYLHVKAYVDSGTITATGGKANTFMSIVELY
jgi:hypothetical protein